MAGINKNKWRCPICGNSAYQRYGGINLPAFKISIDPETGQEIKQSTSLRLGTHFMCKGCSVFFSNPRLFNIHGKLSKE